MLGYPWPGNVRELENVIERAVVIGQGPELQARHLPFCAPVPGAATGEAGEDQSLEGMEKLHVRTMLERHQWNIARTARVLNIDRTTLHKKIKKFGLERPL